MLLSHPARTLINLSCSENQARNHVGVINSHLAALKYRRNENGGKGENAFCRRARSKYHRYQWNSREICHAAPRAHRRDSRPTLAHRASPLSREIAGEKLSAASAAPAQCHHVYIGRARPACGAVSVRQPYGMASLAVAAKHRCARVMSEGSWLAGELCCAYRPAPWHGKESTYRRLAWLGAYGLHAAGYENMLPEIRHA